ncbi:MAG: hypothetical protein IT301_10920 [Dehalococcoidia bacterium]|nr:hypothetical protein [Dehalococcoidia bacterium]
MELDFLIQERKEQRERDLAGYQLLAEAKRAGAVVPSNPRDWLDQALIRLSRGAERRQAERFGANREPVL